MSTPSATVAPIAIAQNRRLFEPVLRAAVGRLNEPMRLISAYQFGWCDGQGTTTAGSGGKAIRPTLTISAARAIGVDPLVAAPAAAAIELVHNFSLLHDDVMDRDLERRHRPTAWTVFGEGQAILAGSALLTVAVQILADGGPAGARVIGPLLDVVQRLIDGQSADLALEQGDGVTLSQCLDMEAGKTAALLAGSCSVGAIAAGADEATVAALHQFGFELGMAFQIVDDILGITGDPAVTGKSASSDLRAGKRSVPIVAALTAGGPASEEFARLIADGPPETESDVTRAAALVAESGGLDWAAAEADRRLAAAMASLDSVSLSEVGTNELRELAVYVVGRDR
ncbi:MAG: polyprenyl synthetase family protein [Frankiales bacterium]|nr:polyprenyl synthetase family protein [Frankiales bacterium]